MERIACVSVDGVAGAHDRAMAMPCCRSLPQIHRAGAHRHRWGENLAGAKAQPVVLSDPTKLVYSPHTYGPSVFMQPYFQDRSFPANMAAIWEARFAYLRARGHPVVIGEMGGFYTGKDREWQDWAIDYMAKHGMGVFYFALQPGSEDSERRACTRTCPCACTVVCMCRRRRVLPITSPYQHPHEDP